MRQQRDLRLADFMKGTLMTRERHMLLPDGEWIQSMKRVLGKDNLFLYWHKVTKKYVVAEWIVRPGEGRLGAVARELKVMEGPPDRCWSGRPSVGWMRKRCEPPDVVHERLLRRSRELQWEQQAARRESMDENREVAGWCKRQGMEKVAMEMEANPFGYVGKREGGEQLEQTEDEIRRMMKS